MTPKEKAKEIYCKYTDALNIRDLQTTANPFAKQCALIAVDEIFFALKYNLDGATSGSVKYWNKVKEEIQNL